jgi:hypothetical protein
MRSNTCHLFFRVEEVVVDTWEDEERRPVVGFDMYEVSDHGRVRSFYSGRILSLQPHKDGYLQVALSRDGKSYHRLVHRLVAMAFSDCTDYSLEVNHVDGDKTYNDISNLDWVTPSENVIHAYRTGLHKGTNKRIQIIENGKEFESLKLCAEYLNVNPASICHALKNDRGSHTVKGYTFRYVD